MGHVHAELMAQYAEDAAETDRPWERWEHRRCRQPGMAGWMPCLSQLGWSIRAEYRRKPRTIMIGDMEVPEPLREAPACEQGYYYVNFYSISGVFFELWNNLDIERTLLFSGMCHLTREAAEQHARALIAVSGGRVSE